MSTEPGTFQHSSSGALPLPSPRGCRSVLTAVLSVLVLGCAPRIAPNLTALCDGRSVSQNLTLSVDSVTPQAGESLRQVIGRQPTIVVTLLNQVGGARCTEQSGTGTWSGALPAALETATDPDRRITWRVEGEDVVLQFNPHTVDNNLGMALPLRNGVGRWWMSTFAGEVASGQVRRTPED